MARLQIDSLKLAIEASMEAYGINSMMQDSEALFVALAKYLDSKLVAKETFEFDNWKATKVVSHRRWWDLDTLQKLVPKGILLGLCKLTPDPHLIDDAIRAGKIKRETVAEALKEAANAPYVKWTKKGSDKQAQGNDDAAALEEAMNG